MILASYEVVLASVVQHLGNVPAVEPVSRGGEVGSSRSEGESQRDVHKGNGYKDSCHYLFTIVVLRRLSESLHCALQGRPCHGGEGSVQQDLVYFRNSFTILLSGDTYLRIQDKDRKTHV